MTATVRLLRAALVVAGWLPLPLLHGLGALAGALAWLRHGRSRHRAEANLAKVMTHESAEIRHATARAALGETGKALFETAAIWGRGPRRALKLVRDVRGEAWLSQAEAAGRGLIVAAPHLGCWELLNYWLAARRSLAIVYRSPRRSSLEPLLLDVRGAAGVEQVRATGAGVRTLYRRLAAGGTVGILPDQRPRAGEGVLAPFFGVPTLTMVLVSRLAQRTGAAVVFAFAERLPHGAGFRLHFRAAPDGIADVDLGTACTALNRGIELCVRDAFEQYQWTYRRFPDTP